MNIVAKNDPSKVKWLLLCFAPIESRNAINDVKEHDYLYHVTDPKNFSKINTLGLLPTSSNRRLKYPDRVYLWLVDDIEIVYNFAFSQHFYYEKESWLVLKVKVDKLPSDIKFFYDPLQNDAIYTTSKIPADAISPHAVVKCNDFNYIIEEFDNKEQRK